VRRPIFWGLQTAGLCVYTSVSTNWLHLCVLCAHVCVGSLSWCSWEVVSVRIRQTLPGLLTRPLSS
jgi:hypothetical protein